MRIWHVHASPRLGPVNGVVQAITLLAAAQRAHGHTVEIVYGTDDDPRQGPAVGTAAGLRRRRLAGPVPDVVHLHELFRPPHLALVPLLGRVPFVLSTHGATAPENLARYRLKKAVYGRLIERRFVRRAGAVVALTPVEKRQVEAWLPGGPPVRVVPNVADPQLLAAPPWEPGPSSELVCLARWDVRHKGLDRLAQLAAHGVDVTVHGAPCGNEPRLLATLQATAPPNLRFAPMVSGPDKAAALRAAAGFVLLSRWEGLAMALLEALALGVPCFVSSEVAETLGHSAPVVVLPDDPAAAAVVVKDHLADVDLAAAGRHWAEQNASPAAVASAMDRVYAGLAGH